MWGITIFGLIVVVVILAVVWAVAAALGGGHASPEAMREDTERQLGVRETTVGD